MSNENNIIIKDACILFDLIDLELIDHFFEMGFVVLTTQAVIDEITDPRQSEIVINHMDLGNISIDQFGNDEFIIELYSEHKGLSLTDCSVIDLAFRTGGILLSSDRSVRKISKDHNIDVHGILWVIQELIDHGIISVSNGCGKLSDYLEINPRAPKRKIYTLIEKLKTSCS